jgi:GntR family transcriptional regulator
LYSGAIGPGEQLPTVRQLAVDLSVNPNTVVRADRELELTGVLTTHQGTGTFPTDVKMERSNAEREQKPDQRVSEFAARADAAAGAHGFGGLAQFGGRDGGFTQFFALPGQAKAPVPHSQLPMASRSENHFPRFKAANRAG